MPHSYAKIYIHYVFAPKSRYPLFASAKRNEIIKYMVGIASNYGCYIHAGYIMPDHIHLLIQIPAKHSVSEIAKIIKANTSRFINTEHRLNARFEWQEGYGAFSCSHSMVEKLKTYINNQDEHHQKCTYEEEYKSILLKHGIAIEQIE